MSVCFAALAAIGALTSVLGLFIAVFGVSYFFIEFGPNTTTFVMPVRGISDQPAGDGARRWPPV